REGHDVEAHLAALVLDDDVAPAPLRIVRAREVAARVAAARLLAHERAAHARLARDDHALQVHRDVPAGIEDARAGRLARGGALLDRRELRERVLEIALEADHARLVLHHDLEVLPHAIGRLAGGAIAEALEARDLRLDLGVRRRRGLG